MDAATWAVIEEGWKEAVGRRRRPPQDAGRCRADGRGRFTMFTIDPGDHVVDAADDHGRRRAGGGRGRPAVGRSRGQRCRTAHGSVQRVARSRVAPELTLEPSDRGRPSGVGQIRRVAGPRGQECTATSPRPWETRPFEVEVSVDETASVTSPFEHWLVASELRRLGVEWVGLAPRFVGDFEKGIDYRGDLELFRARVRQAPGDRRGPRSLQDQHPLGQRQVRVYRVIGEIGARGGPRQDGGHQLPRGPAHHRALRARALPRDPRFLALALRARTAHLPRVGRSSSGCRRAHGSGDDDLPALFEDEDARQVLHVTFGRVLTEKTDGRRLPVQGSSPGRARSNTRPHTTNNLVTHFRRHTAPFGTTMENHDELSGRIVFARRQGGGGDRCRRRARRRHGRGARRGRCAGRGARPQRRGGG